MSLSSLGAVSRVWSVERACVEFVLQVPNLSRAAFGSACDNFWGLVRDSEGHPQGHSTHSGLSE